ncbi:MAG: hypothetical protein PHT59_06485 [Candidatus Omnitrophica bacterium]|nr:hypothetical protein [Candidatus Omnitrophota bacterium]
MSIKRTAEEFPGGVILKAQNKSGDDDVVDKDEYEEMIDDADVSYPAAHTSGAMTLGDVFPGYKP